MIGDARQDHRPSLPQCGHRYTTVVESISIHRSDQTTGSTALITTITTPPKKKVVPLSGREIEVLQLIAEGRPNKETAAELGISIKTVEKHREHIGAKLDIHDTAGLIRYAIGAGIIESCVQLTIT